MTKISVLMPVYNTPENYLREAVESILAQTCADFEFLILNDASTDDNVEKVINSYDDKRIRYWQNDRNLGISLSRNKLIGLSRGEYLAVFDHDDVSLPERLEKQAAFLDAHPEVGVVGCWYRILGTENKVSRFPAEDAEIKEIMVNSCCICHPASMIRRSVLVEHNIGYENDYTPAEDYALWCRLLSKTRFANLPEVLFAYRNHEGNTSHLQREKMRDASIRIQNFVRRDNPELWAAAEAKMQETVKIRLFGLLPLLTIKRSRSRELWLLFGFVRLFDVGRKRVRKSPG
jgi:glycosyltransferase, family 2